MGRWVDRLLVGCGLLTAAGCNPFSAFAECDYHNRQLGDEMPNGVDVEAKAMEHLGRYDGTVSWVLTGTTADVTLRFERADDQPIEIQTDCDGELESFAVPLKVSIESSDGLISGPTGPRTLTLDQRGNFARFSTDELNFAPDFARLKAAGVTPSIWVSGYLPRLNVPLNLPELSPLDAQVTCDEGPVDARKTVVLGNVDFP